MAHHPSRLIRGVPYDFSHLEPLGFRTPSEKLGREILTWCRFTTHTYSRGLVGDEAPDFYDEARKPRIVCADRHALSFRLPEAIRALSEPERYVRQTAAERNWMYEVSVTIDLGGLSTAYQIFFSVKKAKKSEPFDIEMTVESAYGYDPARPPVLLGRMKIAGLLAATVANKKVHTRGSR